VRVGFGRGRQATLKWVEPLMKRKICETLIETMECKMMHDVCAKIDTFFFEGFIKVNCKHCRRTWFYLKIVKKSQSVPFSKVRTKQRKKFLTKAKA